MNANTHAKDGYARLVERGFVAQVTDKDEVARALNEERVTFYVGFDPTADSLHAGSLMPLMGMAHLQRAGHKPIAILGAGTALVGDPSGKTELRQMLTKEQIDENAEGLRAQIGRFIRMGDGPDDGILLNNADWLAELNYIDFLRDIGRHFSVNRMLSFESYKARMERGLSFIEFNYQLLQAYDFLVLYRDHGCSMQMGGDDQWGNIVAGMDLIRRVESKPAYGLTFPLLTTASGEKMGKTADGAVWLDPARTSPYDFFQYFRNTDDRDVARFLGFFTFLSVEQLREYATLEGEQINVAKEVLAFEVTRIVHGDEAAEAARRAAKSAFAGAAGGQADIPSTAIARERLEEGILAVDLFAEVGLVKSKSEARRLVKQGGARVGERKLSSIEDKVGIEDLENESVLLRAGKKRVHRIELSESN
ncbi:MAG: tyrosine--tRNA ligase [Deltaproteobacteria bacterium]|nr:tyrosine--tRNA ligase [Deltaproteobacteria bacterium]